MAKRPLISAMFQGPGPAAYMLPACLGDERHDKTRCQAPAHTMAKRLVTRDTETFNQQLHFPNPRLTRFGVSSIPGSIGIRLKPDKKTVTPGPADYAPDFHRIAKSEPTYTMGSHLEKNIKFITPAPNQYNMPKMMGPDLPTAQTAPNFTMRPRTQHEDYHTVSPGPARYTPDLLATTSRTPHWVFGRKTRDVDAGGRLGPGPAKYLPSMYVQRSSAAHTMGIRHSVYKHERTNTC